MFKVLAIVFFFATTLFADVQDYIIGLNAYRDGFDKMAVESLENYITDSNDSAKTNFAKYVLYKIYLKNRNYEKAYAHFQDIETVKDDRFNHSQMIKDKMFILIEINCKKALDYLQENINDVLASIYLNSECKIPEELVQSVAESNLNPNIKTAFIIKLKNKPEAAYEIAKKTDFSNLKKNILKYIGSFFYNNGYYDIFWNVYSQYKDDDFVNYALKRLFDVSQYENFIYSFETNRKFYNISNSNYCRAIESYQNLGRQFNCEIIDSCYNNKDGKYLKAKLSCFINNRNTNTKNFIKEEFNNNTNLFCTYAEHIITADLYDNEILSMFSKCDNKLKLAEIFIKNRQPQNVITLLENDESDSSLYTKTRAYILSGNEEKARKTANRIKDKSLKERLFDNEK
jgi:hypothetical protein